MIGKLMKISFVTDTFRTYEKIELKVDVAGLDSELNVYDEKDVDLNISLISSSGKRIVMPAFYYEDFIFSEECELIGKTVLKAILDSEFQLSEATGFGFYGNLKD